jgi:hypothetical protein
MSIERSDGMAIMIAQRDVTLRKSGSHLAGVCYTTTLHSIKELAPRHGFEPRFKEALWNV